MDFWYLQIVNGFSYGMLLFMLAAGFSLIFGLMNIINLAQGSYYMLGAYIGLTVVRYSGNFVLGLAAAAVSLTIVGVLMQRFALRRLYGNELGQVLLTFGFMFIIADVSLLIWGGYPQTIPPPPFFEGGMTIGGITFPKYRLLVMGAGAVTALFLWWFQEGTKMGSLVRAAVDDEEMAEATGINVSLTNTVAFGIGAGLAGIAGVIGGPFIGVHIGLDVEVLVLALVVVVVGGLGSLRGAFVGAIIVGLLDNFGKALFPQLSLFTVFAPMAIVLAIKPNGLFGQKS